MNSIKIMKDEIQFRRLVTAGFINGIGDWFNNIAVLGLILMLTGSGIAVGITLALRVLPYLLFGPVAGILADRFSKKKILVITDLVRVFLALSFLFVKTPDQIWIVYISTFLLVSITAIYTPARSALIPLLAKPDNLLAVNSIDQSMLGSVMVIGSVLGGVITASGGVEMAFFLNALSFLFSALLTMKIKIPISEKQSAQIKVKHQVKETYEIIRSSQFVKVMIILSALWPLGGGAVNVLLSVYSFEIFHAGNQGVGILYGSLGLGFILGGGLTLYISRWIIPAAAVGFVVEGLAHIFVSQSPNLTFAALFLFIATVGASVGNASTNTLVMNTIDRNLHGRVFGLFSTLRNSILGATMFFSGLLLEVISPRYLGLLAGVLITAIAAVFGFLLMKSNPVTKHDNAEVK